MPNIRINEKDNTSPGTPGSYANYSVLLTGYKGVDRDPIYENILDADGKYVKTAKDNVVPDSNGVYEFTSVDDFIKYVGGEKEIVELKDSEGTMLECHYGNRMARELLSLGYTVIYKPIESVKDMESYDDFWSIFNDKASYDFRFISHGLLESCYDETLYEAFSARLKDAETDFSMFQTIQTITSKTEDATDAEAREQAYNSLLGGDVCDELLEAIIGKDDHNWFAAYDTGTGQQQSTYPYAQAVERFTADEKGNYQAKTILEEKMTACGAVTPELFDTINSNIAKLACYRDTVTEAERGRGDCIALIELDEKDYVKAGRPEANIIDAINSRFDDVVENGAYCALTVPSVYYKAGKTTKKFPGAFHYLACFMSSLNAGFAEWYAVAGYSRGVSSYSIDRTSVKLGEIAINALEPRNIENQATQPKFACNVIANFRGNYYLWGNRTAAKVQEKDAGGDLVASHFLNIRQLCTTIKKQLYVACRRFTFDPNSDTLWINFVDAIAPTLDAMKADQGIRDYKILKVYTDKKATLKAKIRIIPIEAVEDFDLEISLEDSFGETSAVVTE